MRGTKRGRKRRGTKRGRIKEGNKERENKEEGKKERENKEEGNKEEEKMGDVIFISQNINNTVPSCNIPTSQT